MAAHVGRALFADGSQIPTADLMTRRDGEGRWDLCGTGTASISGGRGFAIFRMRTAAELRAVADFFFFFVCRTGVVPPAARGLNIGFSPFFWPGARKYLALARRPSLEASLQSRSVN